MFPVFQTKPADALPPRGLKITCEVERHNMENWERHASMDAKVHRQLPAIKAFYRSVVPEKMPFGDTKQSRSREILQRVIITSRILQKELETVSGLTMLPAPIRYEYLTGGYKACRLLVEVQ